MKSLCVDSVEGKHGIPVSFSFPLINKSLGNCKISRVLSTDAKSESCKQSFDLEFLKYFPIIITKKRVGCSPIRTCLLNANCIRAELSWFSSLCHSVPYSIKRATVNSLSSCLVIWSDEKRLTWEEGWLIKPAILVIVCTFLCCNHAVNVCVGVQKLSLKN